MACLSTTENVCNITEEHFEIDILQEDEEENHIDAVGSIVVEEHVIELDEKSLAKNNIDEMDEITIKNSTKRKVKRKPVKRLLNKKVKFSSTSETEEESKQIQNPDDTTNDTDKNDHANKSDDYVDEKDENYLLKRLPKKRYNSRKKAAALKRAKKIDDVERLERIHLAFQSNVEPVVKKTNDINITDTTWKILSTNDDKEVITDNDESIKKKLKNYIDNSLSASSTLIKQQHDEQQLSPSTTADLNNSSISSNTNPIIKTEIDNNTTVTPKNEAYQKRKHTCQVCGKKFIGKSNLVDHLRYHANVKPFKCKYCGKQFVQKGTLVCHERTHTQEKPYNCTICSKSFSQASAKNVHIKTHTNERNHICDVCEKPFITSGDLSKHKRTHETIKQFVCEICERGFAQKVNYIKHKFQVHGIQSK